MSEHVQFTNAHTLFWIQANLIGKHHVLYIVALTGLVPVLTSAGGMHLFPNG